MTRVALTAALALAVAVAHTAGAATPPAAGTWVGTYGLSGEDTLLLDVRGATARVSLGPGHAGLQGVALRRAGARIGFRVPGRPAAVVFEGNVRGAVITGTVAQGAARGSFTLRRGSSPVAAARGLWAGAGTTHAVVDDPYGPARLVDLDSGAVRAVTPSGTGLAIGSGFAATTPATGTAALGPSRGTISGLQVTRVPLRQLEVRFPSGGATLAGTLSLPPGSGRRPAVAFVAGSGRTPRAYLPELAALLLRHGVAVLVYDKRGVGQSGGRYPGESPTQPAIDVLARDAAAAARFLAAQPEVDPARVGLAGHSQAGWIAPLAATREPAVRFLVLFSGPAVTADENDAYQDLSGQGERPPGMSDAAIDAEVLRRGPGGVDPLPSIAKLTIPGLWVYGGNDRHVPPRLSEKRLAPLAAQQGRDLTVLDFPGGNHALVETRTGLTSEMLRSGTYAPGMLAAVGRWLRDHGLGR